MDASGGGGMTCSVVSAFTIDRNDFGHPGKLPLSKHCVTLPHERLKCLGGEGDFAVTPLGHEKDKIASSFKLRRRLCEIAFVQWSHSPRSYSERFGSEPSRLNKSNTVTAFTITLFDERMGAAA